MYKTTCLFIKTTFQEFTQLTDLKWSGWSILQDISYFSKRYSEQRLFRIGWSLKSRVLL